MATTKRYFELFKRNQPIIPIEIQEKIKEMNLLVAGCGSTGGAFIEGASRLGVLKFKLAEPDQFELHNLNRQFVYPSEIGLNKAQAHAERLQKLLALCGGEVKVEPQGIQPENIETLLKDVTLVFDAVDVTTQNGMAAKLLLHEKAAEKKYLVLSALDLGFNQWIRVFDYRKGTPALNGKLNEAKSCSHPLKALTQGFCRVDDLSLEISAEVVRLLDNPGTGACQMAAPCHLLAAFTGPILLRFLENKPLPEVISFDLMRHLEEPHEIEQSNLKKKALHEILNKKFAELS